MKKLNPFSLLVFFVLMSLWNNKNIAQSIGAPTHGIPSDPIVIGYCYDPANSSLQYKSEFTFSGSFNGGNQFALEISGPDGIFDADTKTISGPTTFSTSPAIFNFTIPVGIAGESYRLRVRSTSPAVTSPASNLFKAAYYMPYNNDFTLNGNSTSLGICGSGSVVLSIDAAIPSQPSPLGIPGLIYKWYKDNVKIDGQTGTTLTVNSTGEYYAEIDYGSCSPPGAITKSQKIQVSVITSGSTFTLNSSLGTAICPSNPTTLSTTPGYSYKWFKNDVEIPNVTANSYTTGESGTYKVQVGQGSCSSVTNSITLVAEDFDLSIDAKVAPATNYIEEGQTLNITASTSAANPTYEWYEPGNSTPVSTTDTYTVSTPIDGEYSLVVNQTTGCAFPKTIKFKVKIGVESLKVPNLISPNDLNGENDTWILPDEYKASNVEVLILDRFGKEVFRKVNYDDTWPTAPIEFKSINPIYYYVISKDGSPVKKGSITVIK